VVVEYKLRSVEIIASSLCAALYACIGYMTWLGLICPAVGVVRFWPAVVIPAIFAALFGPAVGGLGAAIGIFLSDMLIHGNLLLSLTAGVPANFICFYIVGWLARRKFNPLKATAIGAAILAALTLAVIGMYMQGMLDANVSAVFAVTCIASFAALAVAIKIAPRWSGYHVGSVVGLLAGSLWIGIFVWSFSQVFALPDVVGGGSKLPLYAAAVWTVWTFSTEIPFMLALGPPILDACVRIYPRLRPDFLESGENNG